MEFWWSRILNQPQRPENLVLINKNFFRNIFEINRDKTLPWEDLQRKKEKLLLLETINEVKTQCDLIIAEPFFQCINVPWALVKHHGEIW